MKQWRQRQDGASAAAPDDDSVSLTVYHDYLLAAGWPDRQQLNTELLTEAQRARNSPCNTTREWARKFKEKFAEPAGNTLGGIRLKVIHYLLEREQPMLTGIFSTEEQQGRCPVVGAMFETLEEAIQRYVDNEFDRHLKDLVARQEMRDTARTDIEAFLKDCDPSAGLMTKIHDQRKNLRASALRNLRVDWRALLRMLTSGDASLTDSLFDYLMRSGCHSPGHLFLALLTESLGWNLWLTTNFDTLIEQALRRRGSTRSSLSCQRMARCPTRTCSATSPRWSSCMGVRLPCVSARASTSPSTTPISGGSSTTSPVTHWC